MYPVFIKPTPFLAYINTNNSLSANLSQSASSSLIKVLGRYYSMQILYRGKPYIDETNDVVRLTSVEKKNGRYIILEFSKDLSSESFKQKLRQYI
jgi:hypothetical protein